MDPKFGNIRMHEKFHQFHEIVRYTKISCTQLLHPLQPEGTGALFSRLLLLYETSQNFPIAKLPKAQIREIFLFYSTQGPIYDQFKNFSCSENF